jgi:Family of unknown function (DUF6445)
MQGRADCHVATSAISKTTEGLMTNEVTQQTSILTHGREQQPVIVIDNFVSDPARFIDDAAMLSFKPIGPFYPGVRAVVPAGLFAQSLDPVAGLIAEVFGVAFPIASVESWYSLVTTPPEALAPIQRLPHFDSVDPGRIAVLHYLSRNVAGGTSFFRHRGTKFESVDANREAQYRTAIDADVARLGLPEPAYIAGDTTMFERIAQYEARFNRAIIYRGNTIHCADIPPDMVMSRDPAQGRLTVNSFIQARAS